jgi:phage baseplate assembly protein gpV
MVHALEDAGVVYDSATGRLQVTFEVTAAMLRQAADDALRTAAAATGLKPTRMHVRTTADFIAETEHPAALNLIGVAGDPPSGGVTVTATLYDPGSMIASRLLGLPEQSLLRRYCG